MAGQPTTVVHDDWDVYTATSDDKPMFIAFDVEAAREDLTRTLTHCARVIIPIQAPNPAGGPVEPESSRLYEMEDHLCSLLEDNGIRCRLVGRITYQGDRELVFQLDDWDAFRPPVGFWMTQHPNYQIDVSELEGWDFFDDCVRPTPDTWIYLGDQSVLRNLKQAGSDMGKVHALAFVFQGESSALHKLADLLLARGYQPLGTPDFAGGEIVMVKKMRPDLDDVFAESLAHAKAAAELHVVYDGWGTAVEK